MIQVVHTIRLEHCGLRSILHRLESLAEQLDESSVEALFEPLCALVQYLEETADTGLLAKAEALLCDALEEKGFDLFPTRGLFSDGDDASQRLSAMRCALSGSRHRLSSIERFRQAARSYLRVRRSLLVDMECRLIPRAHSTLAKDDWTRIDRALAHYGQSAAAISRQDHAMQLFRDAFEDTTGVTRMPRRSALEAPRKVWHRIAAAWGNGIAAPPSSQIRGAPLAQRSAMPDAPKKMSGSP